MFGQPFLRGLRPIRMGQPYFGDQSLLPGALQDAGQGAEEMAMGQCYTCANGQDAPQYGIDAATAANLQAQGWDCRRDECASYGSTVTYEGWGMGGIPLSKGLGRRALQG